LIEKGIGKVKVNPYTKDGKALVSKVSNIKNLKEAF